jgi:hypothetical protein
MPHWPMDQSSAHRWFAVEFNNEAWSIVESSPRSPEQIERMLHLAHAALVHWSHVGTPLNRQRALDLLAHAHAAARLGQQSLQYAEQAWQLSLETGDGQTPFDRAEAHSTMAVALRSAGHLPEAEEWRGKALQAASQLDADDRAAIERLLNLPG